MLPEWLKRHPNSGLNLAVNVACAMTLVGIWPRFIEPNLLSVERIGIPVANLPKDLQGFKILQISDLHLNAAVPDCFLKKIASTAAKLKPDLIAFTGDFLCYAVLGAPERLQGFLQSFSAPYGCFAVLGNHDYHQYVGINDSGDYDLLESHRSEILKAVDRLLVRKTVSGRFASAIPSLELHDLLPGLLRKTPFKLLENQSVPITVRESRLNVCGLGEYTAGRFKPEAAFRHYDTSCPGIILLHNPDAAPRLTGFPGDLVLCGHMHGGQINMPWVVDRFTVAEHPEYRAGLYKLDAGKLLYVNRGLGSPLRLRWRSRPELALLTLQNAPNG